MTKNKFMCPFFEESTLTSKRVRKGTDYIECESPCVRAEKLLTSKEDTYAMHIVFKSTHKANEHAEKYCCTMNYEKCRVYKMIMAYKYKD